VLVRKAAVSNLQALPLLAILQAAALAAVDLVGPVAAQLARLAQPLALQSAQLRLQQHEHKG
jgi:hypothetical protein